MVQARVDISSAPNSSCGWSELCFCDAYVCKLPTDWVRSGNFTHQVQLGRRMSATTYTVPSDQRTTVNVVFGINVNDNRPLLGESNAAESWSFMPSFDMSQPWAQRHMLH